MTPARAAVYIGASLLLSLTQGLGMNLVSANIPQVQGSIGATTNEATWLMAAYVAPNASLALVLIKVRNQYGLRNFAELSILGFLLVCAMHLFVTDLNSALVVRFFSGIAAAPMSSLAFLYMLEAFPQDKRLSYGVSLAMTNTLLAAPLARLVSPHLLDIGEWDGLFTFEMALALLSFAAIYLLPLKPQPRIHVITGLDIVSYLLIAVGFGALAVVLTLGRLYWWFEAPWIGMMLAVSIVCVTLAVAVELNRKSPLLDIRWLASREIVHFAAALLTFRIVLSEQSSVAANFFQALGLMNDQLSMLYMIMIVASLAGGLICAAVLKPGREPALHAVALCLLVMGSWLDSQATNLTRPPQMYASQAMIAMAAALFLPPAMAAGLASALKRGPNYILSFFVVFLVTQNIGALLGSAVLQTFVTLREKFHSNLLVEHITLADPLVVQRIGQLSGAYSGTLTDKALLRAEGLAILGKRATQEATILAYNDAFLLVAVLSFLALVALLLHMAAMWYFRTPAEPASA
ncbi:MFS transporter [Mesorhizobium sp. 1B3]|uniref:MFS transporter n=1 Tax=Mesorhizobium sp. 1B3 TaxID=3243599 RepID=UPI003D98A483